MPKAPDKSSRASEQDKSSKSKTRKPAAEPSSSQSIIKLSSLPPRTRQNTTNNDHPRELLESLLALPVILFLFKFLLAMVHLLSSMTGSQQQENKASDIGTDEDDGTTRDESVGLKKGEKTLKKRAVASRRGDLLGKKLRD
ncbi:hypothetical protein B0H66DRAFT_529153 [Apodospora peruviana]|uniref:Uncharacterized protein n=1 Tax=Apodospora peruviana TaxID=516989 RepID=A0AAE0MB12_9PEZI|nr:hypothetical protein B0H66DRAFT_529153 [Apodospora peruviana]